MKSLESWSMISQQNIATNDHSMGHSHQVSPDLSSYHIVLKYFNSNIRLLNRYYLNMLYNNIANNITYIDNEMIMQLFQFCKIKKNAHVANGLLQQLLRSETSHITDNTEKENSSSYSENVNINLKLQKKLSDIEHKSLLAEVSEG
jgi:hypothetical protein